MMTIKDTRTKNNLVSFEDLSVGQVYEDKDGIICIKTSDEYTENNCISFVMGKWEMSVESSVAKTLPLKTTLLIER